MFAILTSPYPIPAWLGWTIGGAVVITCAYFIVLFIKDDFGTK